MPAYLNRGSVIKRVTILSVVSVLCIGGLYGSYMAGRYSGLQEAYFANALHTRNYLAALQCLQGNKFPQVRSTLETSVAAGVVLLAPEHAVLTERTEKAVLDVLGEAKTYRASHPWIGHGPELTSRIESVLSNVQPKPLITSCP